MLRKRVAAFAALIAIAVSVNAQTSTESTLDWVPPAGQDGVEATVQVRIVYNTYLGEPTQRATARATLGNRLVYQGESYTRQQLGSREFDKAEFGLINVEADIFHNGVRISTVRHNNLISGDIAGSPDWDEVFPGVSEERARQAFRDGFQIRNIRLVDVGNYRMDVATNEFRQARRAEERAAEEEERERQRAEEEDERQRAAEEEEAERQRAAEEEEAERQRAAEEEEAERQRAAEEEEAALVAERQRIAEEEAERRRAEEARREFEEQQRRDEERRRAAEEMEEQMRGASAGLGAMFDMGHGLFATFFLYEYDSTFGSEESTSNSNQFVGLGFVAPIWGKRGSVTTSFMWGADVDEFAFAPEDEVRREPSSDYEFYGGSFGLGLKPGGSVFWNLAYPYVSFQGLYMTDYSDYIELTEAEGLHLSDAEPQSEWLTGWEYGLRGHYAIFFVQAGYNTLLEGYSFSFGLQPPTGYMNR